jgi:hypothetical protein
MFGEKQKADLKAVVDQARQAAVMDEVIVQGVKSKFGSGPGPAPAAADAPDPGVLFLSSNQNIRKSPSKQGYEMVRSYSDSNISITSSMSRRTNWYELAQRLRDIR